jgi:hypothetical protein
VKAWWNRRGPESLAFLALVGTIFFAPYSPTACTPQQRQIVRDVTTLIDQLCGDHDTIDTCLGKAAAARAQARAAAAADAGAADAAGDAP